MPFKPLKMLIAYDNTRGMCGRVVPRMKQMLEERAFEVDVVELGSAPVDLSAYKGVVVGSPVGLRGGGPTDAVKDFLTNAEGLDEIKVALFTTYWAMPGRVLEDMAELATQRGSHVVAQYPYWLVRPQDGEHIVPAECMIRVR